MAKITKDTLVQVGAKHIWPPTKLGKKYGKNGEMPKGTKLLVAIVYTPYGQHFKQIYQQSVLDEVRQSPMAADYFELSAKAVDALNEIFKQPRT